VVRAGTSEATALGAAILAAVSSGLHASETAATTAMTRRGKRFEPGSATDPYDRLFGEVYCGLYERIQEPLQRLAALRR